MPRKDFAKVALGAEQTVAWEYVEPTNSEFPAGTSDLGTITVPQDSVVKISVVDVDDAGLSSSPLEMEFTAVDMIPPVAPTGLNVTLKEETA
jgi:hypothetical protein